MGARGRGGSVGAVAEFVAGGRGRLRQRRLVGIVVSGADQLPDDTSGENWSAASFKRLV